MNSTIGKRNTKTNLHERIAKSLKEFVRRFRAFHRKNAKRILFSFLVLVTLAVATFCIGGVLYLFRRFMPVSPSNQIILLVVRLILTLLTMALYYFVVRRILTQDPVHRDWTLFASNGMGMVLYSLHFIVLVLAFICTISYIWGVEGIYDDKTGNEPRAKIAWEVFSQFADPGNIHNSRGRWGHAIALASALLGVLSLSGLAISSIVSIFANLRNQWKQGMIRYKRGFSDYVVIIGVNQQAVTIIQQALRNPSVKYVLIQTRKDVEKERARIALMLEGIQEEKVVFYSGERTLYEDIKSLRLECAKEVYILGEDMSYENEQDHDSFNINCLELVSRYWKEEAKNKKGFDNKLKCHVDLEYQSTYTIFKSTHIYKTLDENVEFLPFNVHEIWAKKVLVDSYAIVPGGRADESKVQRYLPLDSYKEDGVLRHIDKDTDKSVHLFIAGMNQMGTALAVQAALIMHLPNFQKDSSRRTTISFIDENAVREGEFFMGRFSTLFELCRYRTVNCQNVVRKIDDLDKDPNAIDPITDKSSRFNHLGENFIDLQWEFIAGNIASKEVQEYMTRVVHDPQKTCTIAICFNNPQQSIATALCLPEMVFRKVLQVLVYQQNSFDLIEKVSKGEDEWRRYSKLRPFGLVDNCYTKSVFDNVMAKLVHKLYTDGKLNDKDDLDGYIKEMNRLWSEQGIVNKLSNIDLVESFAMKIRSLNCDDAYLERKTVKEKLSDKETLRCLSFAEHNRWLTERLIMGFRPLDKDEMDIFKDATTSQERKYRKRYWIAKNRAHVDIVSNHKLYDEIIDPEVLNNDENIIRNMMDIIRWKNKIITHLALCNEKDGSRSGDLLYRFVKDMLFIEADGQSFDSFWMNETPVTQELWELVMGKNKNASVVKSPDHPVVNVSKLEVDDFLAILNYRTGLHFRLPELGEWRFAAQGGNRSSASQVVSDIWCEKNQTRQVGLSKNVLGLSDMLGNVWEWTNTPDVNKKNTINFCGGSWNFSKRECSLSDNYWCSYWIPEFRSPDLGFRLVLSHDFEKSNTLAKPIEEMSKQTKLAKMFEENMRLVEGGALTLDNSNSEIVEKGIRVEIPSFMIGKTPVTQYQWTLVMGEDNNPSVHRGDNFPVENVSYREAVTFVEKLRKLTGNPKYRLPYEAEWEYAARQQEKVWEDRGERGQIWHNGNTKCTHELIGKNDDLVDMCGNVWEWCRNYYSETPDYSNDITAPASGNTRVLRGGSWRFSETDCTPISRSYWIEDEFKEDDVGFRLAMDVTPNKDDE